MSDINHDDSINNFLLNKQTELDNKKLIKEKILVNCGNVITNFSAQGKNTQSDQEKRNKAVAKLFQGSSLIVLGQVLGIDIMPDDISSIISSTTGYDIFTPIESKLNSFSDLFVDGGLNNTINGILSDSKEIISNNVTESSPQFLKDITGVLLEMNYYLDPNKVDYKTFFSGMATTGAFTTMMFTKDVFASRPYEEKIAKYVEKDLPKRERASFAKNAHRHIQSAGTIEQLFSKIPLFKKPALFVASILNESYQHVISPIDTLQKTWISANIGINNIKSIFSDPQNKKRIESLNKELKEERDYLHVNNYSTAKNKIKKSEYFTDLRNEGADETISPAKLIKEASSNAYSDILKVNVKNALIKSLYVLGKENDNSFTNKNKKEALSVLNDISKLHKRTKDNRFDHYEIISDIASDILDEFRIGVTTKFKEFKNFDEAKSFINEKQSKMLSQEFYMKDNKIDYNKDIVDNLNYKEAFAVTAVNEKIKELKEIEVNKDKRELNKNKNYKKNKI